MGFAMSITDRLVLDSSIALAWCFADEENAYADATPLLPGNATAPIDNTAHITVHMPAKAQLWVEGTKTNSTGLVRELETPPLTPGSRYRYDIKASWKENGREVTQTQYVEVSAGAHFNVTFPTTAQTAAKQR